MGNWSSIYCWNVTYAWAPFQQATVLFCLVLYDHCMLWSLLLLHQKSCFLEWRPVNISHFSPFSLYKIPKSLEHTKYRFELKETEMQFCKWEEYAQTHHGRAARRREKTQHGTSYSVLYCLLRNLITWNAYDSTKNTYSQSLWELSYMIAKSDRNWLFSMF